MITSNVIMRVFYMNYKDEAGTCFIIDIENKQYFVTAKHIIKHIRNGDEIKLYRKDWESFKVKLVGHSEIADISVFTINHFFEAYLLWHLLV